MKLVDQENIYAAKGEAGFSRFLKSGLGSAPSAPVNELALIQRRISAEEQKPSFFKIWRTGAATAAFALAAAVMLAVLRSPAPSTFQSTALFEQTYAGLVAPDYSVDETVAMEDAWYDYIGVL